MVHALLRNIWYSGARWQALRQWSTTQRAIHLPGTCLYNAETKSASQQGEFMQQEALDKLICV
jgi:hypothetical protein